jgi:hypothetical protein
MRGQRAFSNTRNWLARLGLSPRKFLVALRGLPGYCREAAELEKQNREAGAGWAIRRSMPCLHDRSESGGVATGHYFHQDLLVARRILERKPRRHIDFGLRVDGFVAHVAVFRPIDVLDIRPIPGRAHNITFHQADLMNLAPAWRNCCDSLSCLHVLEHLGLGRYGDTMDIDGYRRGFDGLCALLEPGGILYLSFPIGAERIEFNAHRVFSLKRSFDLFRGKLELESFSYVDDRGDLHENATLTEADVEGTLGLDYGCGIFELRKPARS